MEFIDLKVGDQGHESARERRTGWNALVHLPDFELGADAHHVTMPGECEQLFEFRRRQLRSLSA